MPTSIDITTRRRRAGVRVAEVHRAAKRMLEHLGVSGELGIALVGDAEIAGLNRRYRGKNRPTDVLSFPAGDEPAPVAMLGEVVISVETAGRQAAERGVPVGDEIRRLLAHGILHLLGYDHERSPAEARRMFAKQRELERAVEGSRGQGSEGARVQAQHRGRYRGRRCGHFPIERHVSVKSYRRRYR